MTNREPRRPDPPIPAHLRPRGAVAMILPADTFSSSFRWEASPRNSGRLIPEYLVSDEGIGGHR